MTEDRFGRTAATLVLIALYAAAVAVQIVTLPAQPQSILFFDEYHYWQCARDVAAGGLPHYNGYFQPVFPPLYGASLAPLFAFVDHAEFFWWARVANTALLATAILPVYRLARAFADRRSATIAAAFALIGAYHVFAQQLLSENLLVPLVLWTVYRAVRTTVRPTAGRALFTGLLTAAAILTKTLAIVLVPGIVLALLVVARRRGLRAIVVFVLAAALPVALYALRSHWSPGEDGICTSRTTYLRDLQQAGLQSLDVYLGWLRNSMSVLVFGPGTPLLMMGLAGLFAAVRRGAGATERAFAIVSGVFLVAVLAQTCVFAAQMSEMDGNKWRYRWVFERYVCAAWPLFAVYLVTPVARRRTPLLASAAVVIALVAWAPRVFVNAKVAGLGLINFPSTYQGPTIADWLGGPIPARIALLAPLLLAWPLCRGRRWPVWVLVGLSAAYAIHGQVRAVTRAQTVQAGYAESVRNVAAGFDQHIRVGDIVIADFKDDFAYLLALHYGSDFSRFHPDKMSGVGTRRRFGEIIVGVPPRERVWVISEVPRRAFCDIVARHGAYYLLRPRNLVWQRPGPASGDS